MKTTSVRLLSLAACLCMLAPAFTASADDDDERGLGKLAKVVRQATREFRNVSLAEAAGYGAFLGCVSGSLQGAMGVHYASGELVGDDRVIAERPEILVYEPRPNGRMRLVAVEYLVFADAWHAVNETPPVLEGQVFHYTGSPNRYGLPPFYALHVWAWKHNAHGVFADWNPAVSCAAYAPDGS